MDQRTFDFIGRYFWVICIAITILKFRRLSRVQTASGSDVGAGASGDDDISRRVLAALLATWLVMGVGIVFGGVQGVWSYFRPQELNPYVWAWYLCVFAMACVFAYWVILADGAKKAVELRLVRFSRFGKEIQISERWMKIYAAIGPPFVVIWIWLAWRLSLSK